MTATPTVVELRPAFVGFHADREVLVENFGRAPVSVEIEVTPPFTVSARRLDLRGLEKARVRVGWTPLAEGAVEGALRAKWVTGSAEITLLGQATVVPICTSPDVCRLAEFDPATGNCIDVNAADDTPCSAGACVEDARCVAGHCLGRAVDCDDGDRCTRDLCDSVSGCLHEPLAVCPSPGDCRALPNGSPCTTVCGRGVCDQGKCAIREPIRLAWRANLAGGPGGQDGWTYGIEASEVTVDGGTLEWSVVATDRNGAERFSRNLLFERHSSISRVMRSREVLAATQAQGLAVFEPRTGRKLWSLDNLGSSGSFAMAASSDGLIVAYTGNDTVSKFDASGQKIWQTTLPNLRANGAFPAILNEQGELFASRDDDMGLPTVAKVSPSGQIVWIENRTNEPPRDRLDNFPLAAYGGIFIASDGTVSSAISGDRLFKLTSRVRPTLSPSVLITESTIVTYDEGNWYGGRFDPTLYGFDARSGTPKWVAKPTVPFPLELFSLTEMSLTSDGEVVVAVTACQQTPVPQPCKFTDSSDFSYTLHGFEIETGEEVSVCPLPEVSGVDAGSLSGLNLSKGRLIVRTKTSHAYDVPGLDVAHHGWVTGGGNMGRTYAPAEAMEPLPTP